jgi:hypothetical protein
MIQAAIGGELQLVHFARAFMDKFSSDQFSHPESIFETLNNVYLDCDEFEPDAELYAKLRTNLPGFVIDTSEFEKRLQVNLKQLLA